MQKWRSHPWFSPAIPNPSFESTPSCAHLTSQTSLRPIPFFHFRCFCPGPSACPLLPEALQQAPPHIHGHFVPVTSARRIFYNPGLFPGVKNVQWLPMMLRIKSRILQEAWKALSASSSNRPSPAFLAPPSPCTLCVLASFMPGKAPCSFPP